MSREKSIKFIIGSNILKLRQVSQMTQAALAKELNYSDKTVSKWERGEALPDITVLMQIADMFGVTLDYLTVEHDKIEMNAIGAIKKTHLQARAVITGMSLVLVWLIATLIFVLIRIANRDFKYEWLTFIFAIPVSLIVWLVLNTIWFNRRRNYLIISFIMWTTFLSIIIGFLTIGYNVAIILLLGIPGQLIILMWSGLGHIIRKSR